ncbi:MAG: PKD domain-containing protein, partial [Paludibacteraceae bacterium]|nr:PKD domain-containing protein [Paludibacteraceae bacterium]
MLLFLSFSIQVSARDVGAPNIDFSEGNFNGWTMETGNYYRQADSTCTYEWTNVVTRENNRFRLINSAIPTYDSIVSCDGFWQNPFSDGAMTLRIGRPKATEGQGSSKAAAERATYKFVVTDESKALILNFACVLHDPAEGSGKHSGDQIPQFEMNVEFKSPDGVVSTEACASFATTANKTATYLKKPTSPCIYSTQSDKLDEYPYLPWTSTIYDLTNKVGYEVTVTFKTHDCLRVPKTGRNQKEGAGGHEAYGYFYVETTDLKLDVNNCESSGENATIKAPKGFAHYEWKVDGNDSPIFLFTGKDSSEVEIDRRLMTSNSRYTCTMRGELASCSSITLETELLPVLVIPDMKATVGCSGNVEFENRSTLNTTDDELWKYNWDFGDGHNSAKENTSHKYSGYGNYTVKLTAVTKHGCSGTDSFNVTVPDYPTVIIDGHNTVCKGETIELFAQNIDFQTSKITWMDSSKTVISNDTSAKVTIENSSWFYVHVVDERSCGYDDSLYITRVLTPNIKLSATKDTVCSGDSTRLMVSSLVSCTYDWEGGISGSRLQVIPTVTQTFKCTAISLNYGCKTEDSIKIHVNPSPIVDLWTPDELCSGERATIYGMGAESYEWDLGADPITGQDVIYSGPSMDIQPYSDT